MDEPMMRVSAVISGPIPAKGFVPAFHFEFPLAILEDDLMDGIREEVRNRFEDLVYALTEDAPHVWFADECPACCVQLVEERCPNGCL